ncbi:MAG: MoaD/ThiS family protein [Dongiales bacterium]|jgi:molybdopterin synthase sulfur carrier subunit
MVDVVLWGSLKSAAGGKTKIEVEAANIRQLLTRLGEAYPALKPQLERGVSVSIDGRIYRDAWFQPIPPGGEVYILPRLAGG